LSEARTTTYVGILLASAVALAASWSYRHGFVIEWSYVVGALAFAGLVLLGDVFPIHVGGKHTIGAWDIGLAIAIALLGPTWAAIIALPSAFYVGRRDWLRTAYEVGHNITIVYLAGVAFSFMSAPLLSGTADSTTQVVYGTFAASVVLLGTNKAIMTGLLKVKYEKSLYDTWKEDLEPYLLSDAVNVLTAGLGVLALARLGTLAAVVVVVGSIGSQVLVYHAKEQLKNNRGLRARVESLEKALATSNNTFGTMIVQDLGRTDGYTHRHAAATAVYASDLGREMKLDDTRAEQLRMVGLLHNIGLFGLPEDLLLATGKLNSVAQSRLAEHPARGEDALAAIPEFEEMAGWVRWHHERPDGRGYPDKLRGAWIPLEAKILAVAQAYAAMMLDQPRRPGMSFAEVREKLGAGIDTEFDGVVVRAILRILETESEGYRMADDHRFVFPTPDHRRRAMPILPESGLEALEDGAQGLPR
jgi:HD-GYP domain-containing protein (c-di-GMP phosphodiesterase class II)